MKLMRSATEREVGFELSDLLSVKFESLLFFGILGLSVLDRCKSLESLDFLVTNVISGSSLRENSSLLKVRPAAPYAASAKFWI